MKKIAIVILIFISASSKAQTSVYHPFPDSNATWCTSWCNGGLFTYDMATYELDGKVLINGNWYSRMLHDETYCNMGISGCFPGPLISRDTTTYYIRQDSLVKKVWIYQPSYNADTIFFDFNLVIGDTIDARKAYWARFTTFCLVDSIDSISINGQYRNRFWYHETMTGRSNSTIEGIGTDHGLFFAPTCFCEYAARLKIFMENHHWEFGSSDSAQIEFVCVDFTSQIENVNPEWEFTISPNPFHTSAKLTFNLQSGFPNAEFKIYNILGKQVMRQNIISQTTIINRNDLRNGIYFYQVTNDRGLVTNGKFIID